VGRERGEETKQKMDGLDTLSNWNEAGGTKRRDDRKKKMEKALYDGL